MSKIIAFIIAVAAMAATAYAFPAHAAPVKVKGKAPQARVWVPAQCGPFVGPAMPVADAVDVVATEAEWRLLWVRTIAAAETREMRSCLAQDYAEELAAL